MNYRKRAQKQPGRADFALLLAAWAGDARAIAVAVEAEALIYTVDAQGHPAVYFAALEARLAMLETRRWVRQELDKYGCNTFRRSGGYDAGSRLHERRAAATASLVLGGPCSLPEGGVPIPDCQGLLLPEPGARCAGLRSTTQQSTSGTS